MASLVVSGQVVIAVRPRVNLKLSKTVPFGTIIILKVLTASLVRYSDVLLIKSPHLPRSAIEAHEDVN